MYSSEPEDETFAVDTSTSSLLEPFFNWYTLGSEELTGTANFTVTLLSNLGAPIKLINAASLFFREYLLLIF